MARRKATDTRRGRSPESLERRRIAHRAWYQRVMAADPLAGSRLYYRYAAQDQFGLLLAERRGSTRAPGPRQLAHLLAGLRFCRRRESRSDELRRVLFAIGADSHDAWLDSLDGEESD